MTFDRPELLALAPLALLAVALGVGSQWRRGLRLLSAFGGPAVSERLAERDLARMPVARWLAGGAAAILLAVSASGPRPTNEGETSERPIDLVVAVDVSLSMIATDVPGGRAAQATALVERVVEGFPGERVGLTVFADWPYTLVPPTDDHDVVRWFGASVGPEAVADRDQGTGLASAVAEARDALLERGRADAEQVVLLVTDGEFFGDENALVDTVTATLAGGVSVWVAGVGTPSGATLALPGSTGETVVDEVGDAVVSRLNEALLRRVAEAGGGRYVRVADDGDGRRIVAALGGRGGVALPLPGDGEPHLWLALLAIPFLLWEGTTDTPRRSATLRVLIGRLRSEITRLRTEFGRPASGRST